MPVARITSTDPAGTAIGRVGAHRFARAQARQDHRRTAGIMRRRDPGIDAVIRRRHHALPVEGGGDARDAIAAGGEEGRDQQHEHQRAQRHRIARGELRHRPAGPELAGGGERALDMRAPQRLRHGVAFAGGKLVGDCGRRAVLQPAARSIRRRPSASFGHAHDDMATKQQVREDRKSRRRRRVRAAAARATARARTAQEQTEDVAKAASGGHTRSHRIP